MVLFWLVDSPDLSGSGHRFRSSLSPNRRCALTKWNSLRVSRGKTVRNELSTRVFQGGVVLQPAHGVDLLVMSTRGKKPKT